MMVRIRITMMTTIVDEDDTLARMVMMIVMIAMITPQGSHALRNVFITVLAISSLQKAIFVFFVI